MRGSREAMNTNPYAPPAHGPAPQHSYWAPAQGYTYPCARCGGPGADFFKPGAYPLHRTCAGLGPDELHWAWLLLAYSVVVPLGCTWLGVLLACLPYYIWRTNYPRRAKAYNKHVWIAFGVSCAVWGAFMLLTMSR